MSFDQDPIYDAFLWPLTTDPQFINQQTLDTCLISPTTKDDYFSPIQTASAPTASSDQPSRSSTYSFASSSSSSIPMHSDLSALQNVPLPQQQDLSQNHQQYFDFSQIGAEAFNFAVYDPSILNSIHIQEQPLFICPQQTQYLNASFPLGFIPVQHPPIMAPPSPASTAVSVDSHHTSPASPVRSDRSNSVSTATAQLTDSPNQEEKSKHAEFKENLTPKLQAKLSASEKKKLREFARNLTCFNCGTNKTPLWRRTADKANNLCNACGLYYKQYNSHRPVAYKNRNPRIIKKPSPLLGTSTKERKAKSQVVTKEQEKACIENVLESGDAADSLVTLHWGQLQSLIIAARKGPAKK